MSGYRYYLKINFSKKVKIFQFYVFLPLASILLFFYFINFNFSIFPVYTWKNMNPKYHTSVEGWLLRANTADFDYIVGTNKYRDELKQERNDLIFAMKIISLFVYVAAFFLIYFFTIKILNNLYPIKYLSCPYDNCNKSIKVLLNWTCDYCHNKQNKEKLITDDCDHCDKKLETIFCEHCGREFYL